MIISLFLLTLNFCLSKVTMHSSSHNCSIDMRLQWRLGNISAFFYWIDKFFSGVWDWFKWVGEFHLDWVFWWLPCVDYCFQGTQIVSCESWGGYWVICVWLWWGFSYTIRECLNWTKMMVIVNSLLNSVSIPSILFMGLVFLAPHFASSHIISQYFSYLLYCFSW